MITKILIAFVSFWLGAGLMACFKTGKEADE